MLPAIIKGQQSMRVLLAVTFILASLTCRLCAGVEEALAAQDRGDHVTAGKEFQKLADKGDPRAMMELGLMHHTGENIKQDFGKALDWYLKAFEKDFGEAYNNIGVMYRDGLSVETNRPIAYALFYITHMRGLGTDATQIRAGRNLDKTTALMKPEEIRETLKMTEEYVITFVKKRGKLDENDKALKFSEKHITLRKLAEL
jgi:hypothetical protein